ncbi:sarcosine oxidase subunit beta family protein [Ottowia thiooxydans]|uniref:sarcosine oxidase subunit beta family protein n=1 Tax=Ottowia thiooxydans TaxID=219182 RepID=UPI0004199513|nr:sarcosine oxidase subunit beta family protein [Ottowia thiooxydans]
MRYSALSLLAQGLKRSPEWQPAWRQPTPNSRYDVVIIGGGGHGLATAFYLAKNHGIKRIAVLEKGWLGGGNTGRNTTIIRSNYALRANAHFYEHSLKLWERLSEELNFNVMFSQRGVINLVHSSNERENWVRRYNSMRLRGIDAEVLGTDALKERVPGLDLAGDGRYPVVGAVVQPRGGTARHDAVAWGYARAADAEGVDIIQNCEVLGIAIESGKVRGVETSLGYIETARLGCCVAGHSSRVAAMAGLRLPVETHLLQAAVTEPVEPMIDQVVSTGAWRVYVSQTDKGEILMGGRLDGYNSYSQRGSLPALEEVLGGAVALFPKLAGARLMRSWAGAVDMSMDGSPIISKTPVSGFYFNGGWCYGGFKATPASGYCFAHMIANDEPHPLNVEHSLDRFRTGRLLNERGAGPQSNAH